MRFLAEPPSDATFMQMRELAGSAHDNGLDGVLLRATPSQPAPLVTAAAIAGCVEDVLLAVEVPLGDRHPLHVAEEAAVVDLASGGRVILVVHPAEGEEAHFPEAVRLLLAAFAARPFRFEGERWQVPANLPENVHNLERRTRLMPPPRQPRLELWVTRVPVALAVTHALGHLAGAADDDDRLAGAWAAADAVAYGASLPRARRDSWSGPDRLVVRLRAARRAFDQDWSVIEAPAEALTAVGRHVRPRVALDSLPHGLEAHWERAG